MRDPLLSPWKSILISTVLKSMGTTSKGDCNAQILGKQALSQLFVPRLPCLQITGGKPPDRFLPTPIMHLAWVWPTQSICQPLFPYLRPQPRKQAGPALPHSSPLPTCQPYQASSWWGSVTAGLSLCTILASQPGVWEVLSKLLQMMSLSKGISANFPGT